MAVTSPRLSVIIPCFGLSAEIESCVQLLDHQARAHSFEVLVVDSSGRGEIEKIIKPFKSIRLICPHNRLLPGAARNIGIAHARASMIAFLDSDCIPSTNWIPSMLLSMQNSRRITGGPVLDFKPIHPIAWVDNRLQFADFQAGRGAGPGTHFPSCNILLQRRLFEELGGMREDLLSGEDMVFSNRAGATGIEMWFNPRQIVYHHGRVGFRDMLEHQQSLGYHRGWLALAMTPSWNWLAASPKRGPLVMIRRLAYVMLRTWQYDPASLLRLIFSIPTMLIALNAWSQGFYLGVKRRNMEKNQ